MRVVPLWLRDYRRDWLRPDALAGVTAAAVVIPQSMAYATIAGLLVEVGLYTALVPLLVYAVLGTSRPLSVTTTSTIAALTAWPWRRPPETTERTIEVVATLGKLRLANPNTRLLELGRRTPGLGRLCDRAFAGINVAVESSPSG